MQALVKAVSSVFHVPSRGYGTTVHGDHASAAPRIPPYRRPMIPPNRPLAFALGAVIIALSFSATGYFYYSPPPQELPEHKLDRKKEYVQTSMDDMTFHLPRPTPREDKLTATMDKN